jgi:hypothetical protein
VSAAPKDELETLRAAVAEADRLAADPSAFATALASDGLWPHGPIVTRSPAGMWLAKRLGVRAVVVGVLKVTAFDSWGHETSTPTPNGLGEFDVACRRGHYDHLASSVPLRPAGSWEHCPWGCEATAFADGLHDPWKRHMDDCPGYAAKHIGDDDE